MSAPVSNEDAEKAIADLVAQGVDLDAVNVYYVDDLGHRYDLVTEDEKFKGFRIHVPLRIAQ